MAVVGVGVDVDVAAAFAGVVAAAAAAVENAGRMAVVAELVRQHSVVAPTEPDDNFDADDLV